MGESVPNCIRKIVHLDAPPMRVWDAIAVAEHFSAWSGMTFDGPFVAGSHLGARLIAAALDHSDDHEVGVGWYVNEIDPPHRFSVRWHPFPVDPTIDYSQEPTNLVTFAVSPERSGTSLLVEECGFDDIPQSRRHVAFHGNNEGWDIQLGHLRRYLADSGT